MDNGICLTCEFWGGNSRAFSESDFEQLRQASGKCFCKEGNNPHYYNGDRLNAGDGCASWKKHPAVNK